MSVVSNDKGLRAALTNTPKITLFENLRDFLDSVSQTSPQYQTIRAYYKFDSDSTIRGIQSIIEEKFEGTNFDVDGSEYDRKGVTGGEDYDDAELEKVTAKIKKFTIQKISLISEHLLEVWCNFDALIDLTFACDYADYNDSIWDSEDKEYINVRKCTAIENHQVLTSFAFRIQFDTAKNRAEKEELVSDVPSSFGQPTLIDRNYVPNIDDEIDRPNDDGLCSQITKKVTCQICKKEFEVDFSKYAELSSSYEHGEDQMGAERQYDVEEQEITCPHCGAIYRVSGFYTEYPVGCLNQNETVIKFMSAKKS